MKVGNFKITWGTVALAVVSMGIGAYLNYLSNLASNKKLFAQIKEELDKLKEQQQIARLSSEETNRIAELEGALKVLERKIK